MAKVRRLLVVGGAASLQVAPGKRLIDAPGFPEIYRAEALAGIRFLDELRNEKELDWTFLSPSAEFIPQDRDLQLFSSFVQDEITVRPERLQLSFGARVEHNDFTEIGFQPSARMVWTPDSRNMVWAAISRADRTPSRSDTDLRVNYAALPGPGSMPVLVSLFGNPNPQ